MKIIAICGNKKCHHYDNDPNIEINFFTEEVVWFCPECGHENKIRLFKQDKPLPKVRRMKR